MTEPLITIATHGNVHHEDEVVAVAILTTIFKNNQIIRTRDETVIRDADIVVDVGGVYDHTLRRYDHHMRNPPMDENGHIFSSAGLVWLHYADSYLAAIGIPRSTNVGGMTVPLRNEVKLNITQKWIQPIDLVDNGIMPGPTLISEMVRSLRPMNLEKTSDKCDKQFQEAVDLVSLILERTCFHQAEFAISRATFVGSHKQYLSDNKILVSDTHVPTVNQFCTSDVHFVIFPVKEYIDEDEIRYIINPVPVSPNRSFKTPIPDELLGARTGDIEKLTGCTGVFYIHHSGFVIRSPSKEEAINFCEYLLSQQK